MFVFYYLLSIDATQLTTRGFIEQLYLFRVINPYITREHRVLVCALN